MIRLTPATANRLLGGSLPSVEKNAHMLEIADAQAVGLRAWRRQNRGEDTTQIMRPIFADAFGCVTHERPCSAVIAPRDLTPSSVLPTSCRPSSCSPVSPSWRAGASDHSIPGPTMPPTLDLDTLTLGSGKHDSIESGACVMEAVAYINGEPWTDSPKCVSPLLAGFCRSLNDVMENRERQQLKPLIPILSGTNTGAADDQTRGLMCADWIVRTYTPAWMTLAGLTEQANLLRSLPEITTWDALVEATPALIESRKQSDAAWDAARAAARDAAWDAAWDAARAAAWDAARAAARDAAWAAARAAAWDAARDAAWAAARDAARDALKPTVTSLRSSAVDLAKRMANVGR